MKIYKFNLPTIYTRVISNFNLGICIPNLQPIKKIVRKISVRIAMIPRDSLGTQA